MSLLLLLNAHVQKGEEIPHCLVIGFFEGASFGAFSEYVAVSLEPAAKQICCSVIL